MKRLISMVPAEFGNYFEPMIGAGALFFTLQPESGVIADANQELINFYRVLRDDNKALCAALEQLKASNEEYYKRRAECPQSALARAIRFYYLNRLCWNGLHRVNLQGEFNVPFGGRLPKTMCNAENLRQASLILKNIKILHGDFEDTTAGAQQGDFVYLDPPYPKGTANRNSFSHYNKTRFTYEDHQRLAKMAQNLAERGVYVMITESARPEIRKLYESRFFITTVESKSLIAGRTEYRRKVREAIITSYDSQPLSNP